MTPSLRFHGQPFRDEDTLAAYLTAVLSDPGFNSLTIAVAWARFGGLRRFAPQIETFKTRGARVQVILGIDEGVASRPGLKLAMELADSAFVFHDPGPRTFHPKLYLAEGPDKAALLVGSPNFTGGGLVSNYEASLEATFSLPGEAEEAALVDARRYLERLLDDRELCRPLDGELLDRLFEDPRYAIAAGEARGGGGSGPDREDRSPASGEPVFGTSLHEKASTGALSRSARAELRKLEAEVARDGGDTPVREEAGPVAPRAPGMRWTKKLPSSDAQHPPGANSNPVGNLRLTKAGNKIDWLTWFRSSLFGAEKWSIQKDRRGNPVEIATVPFEVTIEGKPLGRMELRVDHAPHREEGQHNHATVLHWGPLSSILRSTDYTGHTVAIERRPDGRYLLDIVP